MTQRFLAHLAAGNWDAVAATLVDDFCQNDRRRVVGAGIRHGRDEEIRDLRAIADLGITNVMSTVIATRGERLALMRVRFSFRYQGPEAFLGELLGLCEINADKRIVADVSFDLDDIDAAFDELDRRYLAGEAAAYAGTWSVVSGAYAAMNRRELFATTPDWANVDHRRPGIIEDGGLNASLRSLWTLEPDVSFHVEAVHRLTDLGEVCTHAAHGVSRDGFDAEWRGIEVMTVDRNLINRCEIFDEADIDTAITRFEELGRRAPRLENAASQVAERFFAHLGSRNWAAMADILADEGFSDDRRRVVNAGLWRGRDVVIAELRETTDFGVRVEISELIATRGWRVVLSHVQWSIRDQGPQAFRSEALSVTEVEPDGRIAAIIMFDLDDVDAAFAELDARYLAGEGAAHAHTWSVITGTYASFNRQKYAGADWSLVDHRRGALFASGNLTTAIRGIWDLTPDLTIRIEEVHRVSDAGAVITHTSYGSSLGGFDAEWRMIQLLSVEGDRVNCCELFDEADIDAALARFEEMQPRAPWLDNAASQAVQGLRALFAARDWAGMAERLAEDIATEDRRRVVNAGIRHGRDAEIKALRAAVEVGTTDIGSTLLATRGTRLVLGKFRFSSHDQRPTAFHAEMLGIVEIDSDDRIATIVMFDLDDFDVALAELDARYLAGEAAAHSRAWSVIAGSYAALNRREIPATTSSFVDIDHRPLAAIGSGDLKAYLGVTMNDTRYNSIYIEAVHRLTDLGAVVTHAASGTSRGGFYAEWRMTDLFTVEGSLLSRCEIFDEADVAAALARFAELDESS